MSTKVAGWNYFNMDVLCLQFESGICFSFHVYLALSFVLLLPYRFLKNKNVHVCVFYSFCNTPSTFPAVKPNHSSPGGTSGCVLHMTL